MMTEIVSSKIIAPFYGNSLYVWTSVFTITILGLTVGYLIGGLISQKKPKRILILSILMSFILVYLLQHTTQFMFKISADYSLKIGVLLFSFFIIFPIVFCYGIISPLLIQLLTKSASNVGRNSGLIYAVSTLGGIIMTFFTGLHLIPEYGISFTIHTISILLLMSLVISLPITSVSKIDTQKEKREDKRVQTKTTHSLQLYILAFTEGALVIAIELFGSKLIQPFVGNSLIVWTIVIGITLLFLSLGYLVGGILAKKENNIKWIYYGFSIASILFLFSVILSNNLFERNIEGSIIMSSILITSLLIGPALLFLGLSSPLIIQNLTINHENAGKNAGFVYSISSFGGILMSLFIGMYVLETWGLILPIIFFSFLLISISLFFYRTRKQYILFGIYLFIGISVYSKQNKQEWKLGNIKIQHFSEGLLGQLKVYDEFISREGLEYRYLSINGIHQTMIVNNEVKISAWNYVHRIARISSLRKGGNALLLGLGGGSIASELNKLDFKVDIVDIDKRMFDICKKYFYFNDLNSDFFVDDARHFIRKSTKKYDLIIVDLLNGEVQPSNVFSKEALNQMINLLTKKGIIIVNFQELNQTNSISSHHSICNTFLSLDMNVYFHKNSGETDVITVISKHKIDINNTPIEQLSSSFPYLGSVQELVMQPFKQVDKPFKDGIILTDDRPILDKINTETILDWRKNAMNDQLKKHLLLNLPIYQ
jgi:spermidine synthase